MINSGCIYTDVHIGKTVADTDLLPESSPVPPYPSGSTIYTRDIGYGPSPHNQVLKVSLTLALIRETSVTAAQRFCLKGI